eukprot:762858-Hanusia_phi.AAC.1
MEEEEVVVVMEEEEVLLEAQEQVDEAEARCEQLTVQLLLQSKKSPAEPLLEALEREKMLEMKVRGEEEGERGSDPVEGFIAARASTETTDRTRAAFAAAREQLQQWNEL